MSSNFITPFTEIKLDHDNIRELYQRYKNCTAGKDERSMITNTLIRELAIHSDAEEVSVYNDYLEHDLKAEHDHDIEEHAQLKKLVYKLDSTSVDDAQFSDLLDSVYYTFEHHAKDEEDVQLPKLMSSMSSEKQYEAAFNFLKARKAVPTRPHPIAPQTGGIIQKVAGMQGKLHDKIYESMAGRKFVDLKYQHPDISDL